MGVTINLHISDSALQNTIPPFDTISPSPPPLPYDDEYYSIRRYLVSLKVSERPKQLFESTGAGVSTIESDVQNLLFGI